ncbi:Pre-mRNA processing ribonucleoprotein, binding domain protein [Ferroglobus placidus DSM 10642]|uniref:Pre-mRNA processing ribonucleoprotein, binding domain protein n=1 Tax=Ferroglobus placidus (strain DSM 10642 / AEDII12DO) TaxID=589924 RepID=D3S0M8_FERPA|nr:NOP5/NOP56 family protein [Ferroglobus placidus]ADC66269.1 Pre-mRNA processing ribonucleoprotein, binding domain protein [Ferroglobus placidus DSM 10642]
MKYNLWCGEYDGKLKLSNDLEKSFLNAKNPGPVPEEAFEEAKKKVKNYYETLRKVAIEVTERKVERELRREDRYVIMLVKALDELNETINLLEEKYRDLVEVKTSEISEEFEEKIRGLKELRRKIEKEIDEVMGKIAPNLTEILGAKIAARLLERAGSMEKLAILPASTIQIIGAEKSLFKALTRIRKGKKAKIPKHGIIFQHPFIRTLPKKKRGKMARFMAGKLAIAAKLDYFSGELKEELAEEVRRKYEELARA